MSRRKRMKVHKHRIPESELAVCGQPIFMWEHNKRRLMTNEWVNTTCKVCLLSEPGHSKVSYIRAVRKVAV